MGYDVQFDTECVKITDSHGTTVRGPLSPITQHYEIRLSALSVLSSPVSPSDSDEYGPYLQAYYQARVQPNLPYTTEQRTRARQVG
ncbi:hypothetical protein B484DRAFT_425957 [Ochromonadaceae sp. CCMP2298]|nr:hypothetical protein B484DRAFT_425957 [Ochromonadaceae sp. CCMP2298]